jgi:putative oxidoreductase
MTNVAASGPASGGLLARYDALCAWLALFPLGILTLMFRLGLARDFFASGLTKIDGWNVFETWSVTQTTVVLFAQEYKVPLLPPEFAANLAALVELTCPIFLALGLLARLAALPMLGMAIVIQVFVYPGSWSTHIVWMAILLLVITRGPGEISLDYLIRKYWFKQA